jgi:hypothetical protein
VRAPPTWQPEPGKTRTPPSRSSRHSVTPAAAAVLGLQRDAGNQAVTSLLGLQRVGPDGTITDPQEMGRTRPVGGSVDVETRVRVIEALLAAPRSRAILDEIARLRGNLDFPVKWSAQGGYHRTGEIWLDRTKNEAHWLKSMAHEITHLQTFLAGRAANITMMSRGDYVNAKMTDEIEAHAASYVALLQLGALTAPAQGFAEFRRHLARQLPTAVRKGRWSDVEGLAKRWVEQRYRTDPAWRTANTGENYYDYWGAAWDRAHPGASTP